MARIGPKQDDADGLSVPAWLNALSRRVLGACIEVHRTLGPGLLERMYEEAVCHELSLAGLPFERQVPLTLPYKGILIEGLRLDLVIDSTIIVELKATDAVPEIFLAQVMSYCKAFHAPLGLLVNFNVPVLKDGMYRRINRPALEGRMQSIQERERLNSHPRLHDITIPSNIVGPPV